MTDPFSSAAQAAREQHRDPSGRFGTQPAVETDIVLGDAPDWRDQTVTVMGRRFTMGQVRGGRLFHGTTARLAPGDEVTPGAAPVNHAQSDPGVVSLTSDPSVARHWAREAARSQGIAEDRALVVEVEPASDLEPWRLALADGGRSFDVLEARASGARAVGPAQ